VVDWLFHAVLLRTSFFLASIDYTLFGGKITFFSVPNSDPSPSSQRPDPETQTVHIRRSERLEASQKYGGLDTLTTRVASIVTGVSSAVSIILNQFSAILSMPILNCPMSIRCRSLKKIGQLQKDKRSIKNRAPSRIIPQVAPQTIGFYFVKQIHLHKFIIRLFIRLDKPTNSLFYRGILPRTPCSWQSAVSISALSTPGFNPRNAQM
jgi:hypothetical protein